MRKKRKNRNHLFFIAPGFIFYTVFVVLPILCVLVLGFTNWSGMGEIKFIGLDNFITIFTDERFTPTFFNALKNNLKYLVCVWLIITPIQYLIAYVLYIKDPGAQIPSNSWYFSHMSSVRPSSASLRR